MKYRYSIDAMRHKVAKSICYISLIASKLATTGSKINYSHSSLEMVNTLLFCHPTHLDPKALISEDNGFCKSNNIIVFEAKNGQFTIERKKWGGERESNQSFLPWTQVGQQVVSDVDQILHLHTNFLCTTTNHRLSFQGKKKHSTTINLQKNKMP